MTAAAASDGAFRDRLLGERTRRGGRGGGAGPEGAGEGAAARAGRLGCAAGPRLAALEPGLVVRVHVAAFQPIPLVVPAASGIMLGVFTHNGLPHSLLELSRLLGPAEAGVSDGAGSGLMLLLREPGRRRVGLRVDAVLGTPALRPAGDGRHALLPDDRLALLVDAVALWAAIDRLDDAADAPLPSRS